MRRRPETDDALADLRSCGAAYRRFALDNPTYYSVMFDRVVADTSPSAAALEQASATLQLLADRLDRAMEMRRPAAIAIRCTRRPSLWATSSRCRQPRAEGRRPAYVDWARVFETTMAALVLGLVAAEHRPRTARGRPAG